MRAKVWFSSKTHFRQRSPIRMPRIGALRLSFSKHKASSAFLRKPRDEQNVFGNACNNVANARKFFVGLATLLQTLESFSWDLQQCCKRQKIFRGTCNGVANARKFFVGLATVLQTPESFSRDLQQCCKRQKVFRGTCNSVANARKFFERLATVLQAFPKTLWLSQCAIQDILQK